MIRSSVDLPQPDGPDHDDELARLDREAHALDGAEGAVVLGDVLDDEAWHHSALTCRARPGWTKYFCEKKKTVTIGTMAIDSPAITAGQSEVNSPWSVRRCRPAASSAPGRVSISSASRNSFQMNTAWKIEALASAGPESGRMTRKKIWMRLQLSSRAASSSSRREVEEEGVEEDRRERDAVGGVGQHDARGGC